MWPLGITYAKQVTLKGIVSKYPLHSRDDLQDNHPGPPSQINMVLICVGVHLDHISSRILFNLRDTDAIFWFGRFNPIFSFVCHLDQFPNFSLLYNLVEM